ncbi:MAG TPA: CHRD domain-containing protein [Myxococcales bacterium]|nr:CHRD domain-containing protein [Myxococcales bacterium]
MVPTRLLCAGMLATLAACGGSSSSFSANLDGASEVPATGAAATAAAAITVNGSTVSYKVTFSNLSGNPTMSHIHVGASGVNGGVAVPFSGLPASTSGTFEGTFAAADVLAAGAVGAGSLDDLMAQMRAGNTYVNIHTAAHPGGEIRGQLHAQ